MSMDHDDSTQSFHTLQPSSSILTFPGALQPSSVQPVPVTTMSARPMGPIEYGMRRKLETLKGSKYPDSFDWSIYDRISDRFGDDQPRAGVVFKTTFKLVNYHTSCSKCHYAFELDSYGRGCIHNCAYCYAKDQLTSHGIWNRPMPFPVDLSEIRKIMYTIFETDKPSKWREVMGKRVPLRIGSMSDSFMHVDKKYGVTKELLKILSFYEYPHIIFTRSDLVADDEYLKIMKPRLVSIQMSMSGNDERITRLVEPGAPSVTRRLAALNKAAEAGFWTTVRLNPFFPTHPDGYYTDPESIRERFGSKEQVPEFNWFNWDMLDELKDAKVPSVLAGVVRLSGKAINNMSNVTGVDFKTFFRPEELKGRGDRRFSDKEIAYYYLKLKEESSKRGIRFNTCYIGNGEKDYYQYQLLWNNRVDCCDAVGNVPAFKTTSQSVSWDERLRHSPAKSIAEKSMEQDKLLSKQYSKLPDPRTLI
ncbi:MAG: hypothetical protein J0L82_10195 [Deltaproteobacteria bacterium]|jgi:DNA repair photolyase|nr:hypothetical protein [Deltaproteobacteria bacterium]